MKLKHCLHLINCYIYPLLVFTVRKIVTVLLLLIGQALVGQTSPFKDKNHWGIKENKEVLIPALFDTILNFDEGGKVCMACFKVKSASANKFMRTNTVSFACNYLNKKQQKLRIKTTTNDTCTVFSYSKNSFKQYTENPASFEVSVKGIKYLVDKDFKQLTFNEYLGVWPSLDPGFYLVQKADESETLLTGLVDTQEKEIIPCRYSHIRINPVDSLIMGCSAGIRENGDDDLFDYSGKKIDAYKRHIEMATKHFIIHKIFIPKEYYVLYNIKTKEEKTLNANEVHFFEHDEILIRIKDDWYVYDLNTNQKKPKQY